MIQILLSLLGGLVCLYIGAAGLVRGSSSIALKLGVSPLVIGLTIVAFGTSAPELVVSSKAALDGSGAIAIGNVVGSNIFNIAVILGLSALIYPLRVNLQVIRLDTPVMIVVSFLLLLFQDLTLSRLEGLVLALGIVVYIVGSNIFNILCILGVSSVLSPLNASGISTVDMYVMIGTAVLLLPLMRTGFGLNRGEGGVFLCVYGGYLYYLWPN